jgi:hypothetical protein
MKFNKKKVEMENKIFGNQIDPPLPISVASVKVFSPLYLSSFLFPLYFSVFCVLFRFLPVIPFFFLLL